MNTPFSNILRGLCPLAVGAAGVAFAIGHMRLGGVLLVVWSVCELTAFFYKARSTETTPDDGAARKRDTRAPLRR